MALTFGAVSSNRVDIGTGASVTGLNPFTICVWVFCTTRTTGRAIWTSRGSAANNGIGILRLSGTTGNLEIRLARVSTATSYITNDIPLPLNQWCFIAADINTATTPSAHLYTGTLTTPPVQSTYSTAVNGAGAVTADTGTQGSTWGNQTTTGSFSLSFQGRIAKGQIYNRVLSIGEVTQIWMGSRPLAGCVNYIEFGHNSTGTQPDWSGSGNAGTVTGATLTPDHVPLPSVFGY